MAGLAVSDPQARMLEHERPFRVGVTANTSRLTVISGPQLSAVEAAVGLMAVNAFHRPFLDPVMEGLREVAAAFDVTAKAEVVGRLFQQPGHPGGGVDPVAVAAGEAALAVPAALVGGDLLVLIVAGQTLFVVLLHGRALEGGNLCLVSAGRGMFLSGSVAGFAGILEVEFGTFFEDHVRIHFKPLHLVLVTNGTILVVYAPRLGRLGRLLGGILRPQPFRAEGEHPPQDDYRRGQEQEFNSS